MDEESKNRIHPTIIAAIITGIIALIVGFGTPILENLLNRDSTPNKAEEKREQIDEKLEPPTAKRIEEDKTNSAKQEKQNKKVSGVLEFLSKPESDFYYIGIRGTDNLKKIGLTENFNFEIDQSITFITLDVYDKNKDKITSKTTQCCEGNLITIRIP